MGGKKSMESSKREKGCCLLNPIPAKTSFAGENERYISGVMQSFWESCFSFTTKTATMYVLQKKPENCKEENNVIKKWYVGYISRYLAN